MRLAIEIEWNEVLRSYTVVVYTVRRHRTYPSVTPSSAYRLFSVAWPWYAVRRTAHSTTWMSWLTDEEATPPVRRSKSGRPTHTRSGDSVKTIAREIGKRGRGG